MHPESWYEDRGVQLLRGAEVVSLRPAEQVVELRGGRRVPYDRLLLAAGAHPILPPFPGASSEGETQHGRKECGRTIRGMASEHLL